MDAPNPGAHGRSGARERKDMSRALGPGYGGKCLERARGNRAETPSPIPSTRDCRFALRTFYTVICIALRLSAEGAAYVPENHGVRDAKD